MQGVLMSEIFGWVTFVLLSEGPSFLFAGGGERASMSARHVSCVGRRWLVQCGLKLRRQRRVAASCPLR
jgi:hypothetical protein